MKKRLIARRFMKNEGELDQARVADLVEGLFGEKGRYSEHKAGSKYCSGVSKDERFGGDPSRFRRASRRKHPHRV